MVRIKFLILLLCSMILTSCPAQLKFIIEDFEGYADGTTDLKANGIFTYGNTHAAIEYRNGGTGYSGERFLRAYRSGSEKFGGWGKGITQFVELDQNKDHLNFYIRLEPGSPRENLQVELQDDDNGNSIYEKNADDSWIFKVLPPESNEWQLISIPLDSFVHHGPGGDGVFNINYKQGKLLCLLLSFPENLKSFPNIAFDMLCFSEGKLPTGATQFDPPGPGPGERCVLGTWSKEGNTGNFSDIAAGFENGLKYGSEKKIGVVHFFQPFSVDASANQKHYPSPDRINKIIQLGYVPMITLEDHFPNANPTTKQPNLYSIVEGHFDPFFAEWAKQIRQVKGIVLLRILHEFNGDWYPWCIANNDHNPKLLAQAFQHIRKVFMDQQVSNVKFIWCPNSISVPQEKWNFIMDAYPGDEYVDLVGLDIYNGAGKESSVWRSFRKEGIENYFLLTKKLPAKPLIICETASRERKASEPAAAQDKAGWIRQMSEALETDMSGIKLMTWFNEKETFKVNSSEGSQGAFLDFILKNDHFSSGSSYLSGLLEE